MINVSFLIEIYKLVKQVSVHLDNQTTMVAEYGLFYYTFSPIWTF